MNDIKNALNAYCFVKSTLRSNLCLKDKAMNLHIYKERAKRLTIHEFIFVSALTDKAYEMLARIN